MRIQQLLAQVALVHATATAAVPVTAERIVETDTARPSSALLRKIVAVEHADETAHFDSLCSEIGKGNDDLERVLAEVPRSKSRQTIWRPQTSLCAWRHAQAAAVFARDASQRREGCRWWSG